MTTTTPAPTAAPLLGASANRTRTAARGYGDVEPAAPSRRSQPELVSAENELPLEMADRVARDLFSVSLTLSSARSLSEGLASACLDEAIDELDGLVHELHRAALDGLRPNGTPSRPGVEPVNGNTSATKADPDLVEQAANALTQVDGVLVRLWTDGVAETGHAGARERITDATRFVRLGRISLRANAVG
jgi:hypothetical protein